MTICYETEDMSVFVTRLGTCLCLSQDWRYVFVTRLEKCLCLSQDRRYVCVCHKTVDCPCLSENWRHVCACRKTVGVSLRNARLDIFLSQDYTCVCTCHMASRGVTVSTSAFLACHQCYCAGSSLTWGLDLRALVFGIF